MLVQMREKCLPQEQPAVWTHLTRVCADDDHVSSDGRRPPGLGRIGRGQSRCCAASGDESVRRHRVSAKVTRHRRGTTVAHIKADCACNIDVCGLSPSRLWPQVANDAKASSSCHATGMGKRRGQSGGAGREHSPCVLLKPTSLGSPACHRSTISLPKACYQPEQRGARQARTAFWLAASLVAQALV